MKKPLVAANWKMNKTHTEFNEFINQFNEELSKNKNYQFNTEVVICPPYLYLAEMTKMFEAKNINVGSQNISEHSEGAYTGEISASMLKSINVKYCIIGHSERRKYFNETNEQLAKKIDIALKNDLIPIFCCGETFDERQADKQFAVVDEQLKESLFHLPANMIQKCVIAYEPVWAIGTGLTASSSQAQEMHAFIRDLITNKYNFKTSSEIRILYGGSCNSKNAKELFCQNDIDGGLIGGASLKHDEFIKILLANNE